VNFIKEQLFELEMLQQLLVVHRDEEEVTSEKELT
jgi:hypothetical protein